MNEKQLIDTTVEFLKERFVNAEGGHDWHHTERVWTLAKRIGEAEGGVDMLVVELGALLHDVADAKFHSGDEDIGPRVAREFLTTCNVDSHIIDAVELIIRHISWKSNVGGQKVMTPELAVVQDADRLEAIGAIGIARAFNYGGHNSVPIYNPDIKPNLSQTKEEYRKGSTSTINHFYEKLLLVKDRLNTATGKKIALERHRYMESFLAEFYAETRGER